jgi:hypothetical protein
LQEKNAAPHRFWRDATAVDLADAVADLAACCRHARKRRRRPRRAPLSTFPTPSPTSPTPSPRSRRAAVALGDSVGDLADTQRAPRHRRHGVADAVAASRTPPPRVATRSEPHFSLALARSVGKLTTDFVAA